MIENHTRSYGLDFLKVIATFAIVFHHFQQVYMVHYDSHINFCDGNFYWGNLVELFFVISGYVVYRYIPDILEDKISFGSWFEKRYRRILPSLFVSAFIAELVHLVYYNITGNYFYFRINISVWNILLSGLGMHYNGVFAAIGINTPTWYISVLLLCYVIFYIATYVSKKLNCKPVHLYIFMIVIGLAGMEFCLNQPFLTESTCRGYYSFFTGLLLAQYVDCFGISRKEVLLSIVALAAIIVINIFKPEYVDYQMGYFVAFFVAPALVFLVESNKAKRLFNSSFWQKWGAVSYNVYIWHLPIFMVLDITLQIAGITLPKNSLLTMYIYLIVVELFAVFSHLCIEKPLDRLWGLISDEYKSRYKFNKT